MGNLSVWLLSIAGPFVIKALTALGIGTLTFAGVTEALSGLLTMAKTNWSAMPVNVLTLATLAGIPQGLGIIAGAYTSRVAMWVAASATKWITSK